jgi:ribonuclease PH
MKISKFLSKLIKSGKLTESPITESVAAISVGLLGSNALLDLEYTEDSICDTDMNIVMTGQGDFIEVQGTAEGAAFKRTEMNALLDLAEKGIRELIDLQNKALAKPLANT